eukprot:748020-Hanusia_phi.AAC.6
MGKTTRRTKEESNRATEIVHQLSAVSKTSSKRKTRAASTKKNKDADEPAMDPVETPQSLSLVAQRESAEEIPSAGPADALLASSLVYPAPDAAADSSLCSKVGCVEIAAMLTAGQGQEWTAEEDEEVIAKLRVIRSGELSTKNMTHRTVNAIKFRWNDKLKKKFIESNSTVDLQIKSDDVGQRELLIGLDDPLPECPVKAILLHKLSLLDLQQTSELLLPDLNLQNHQLTERQCRTQKLLSDLVLVNV